MVCGVVCSEVCGVVTVAVGRMWCGVRLQCVVLSGVVWGVCCGVCRVRVSYVVVMCGMVSRGVVWWCGVRCEMCGSVVWCG